MNAVLHIQQIPAVDRQPDDHRCRVFVLNDVGGKK